MTETCRMTNGHSSPTIFNPKITEGCSPCIPNEISSTRFSNLNKTGAQWRMLPKGFPPWKTIYDHFSQPLINKGILAILQLPTFSVIQVVNFGGLIPTESRSFSSTQVLYSALLSTDFFRIILLKQQKLNRRCRHWG